ncbi:MAG: haloacid dehalogenase-like hydrolase [Cystobacter sp.]
MSTCSFAPSRALRLSRLLLAGGLIGAPLSCSDPRGLPGPDDDDRRPPLPLRLLDDRFERWLPDNRQKLNALIHDVGSTSATFDPDRRPVAVFDWDNTLMKNDMGDATFFWMLRHDKVLQPADKDWSTTSRHLTEDALRALATVCGPLSEPGTPLPTSLDADCADELVSIYTQGRTRTAQAAWSAPVTLTFQASYAWLAQLQAGYMPEELRAFARAAYAENAAQAPGTTQTVGSTPGLPHHARIYEEMVDLVGTLRDNGFDIWVLSASPQFVIDALSQQLIGVEPGHVVGIRSVTDARGRLTARLQGCGPVPDGEDTLITYDQGKRCWINKALYHLPPEQQLARQPDERQRQVFAAGDSDTDLAFMQDATRLKLAINRNKVQLMCNAYANLRGTWLVQPMFVQPAPQAPRPYPCTTALDAAGQPIVDEEGQRFRGDMEDTVHRLP